MEPPPPLPRPGDTTDLMPPPEPEPPMHAPTSWGSVFSVVFVIIVILNIAFRFTCKRAKEK
jgi:hypothetical protein